MSGDERVDAGRLAGGDVRGQRYPVGRPIEVAGGLRARSARGDIGRTWWSRRFLSVLESITVGGRLARGRNYARRGQVLDLHVNSGAVTARVQGSVPEPYRVRVGVATLPAQTWVAVEQALAASARYSALLLSGTMPPDIEDLFAKAGTSLFPAEPSELAMRCDCPDQQVPCKHLAAVCYLLAEQFDADPFRILRWRGRERDILLAALRRERAAPSAGVLSTVDAPVAGQPSEHDPAVTLAPRSAPGPAPALAPERFFLPPVPLPKRPVTPPAEADLLLRLLPVPAEDLGGPQVVAQLRAAYRRFSAGA